MKHCQYEEWDQTAGRISMCGETATHVQDGMIYLCAQHANYGMSLGEKRIKIYKGKTAKGGRK